MLYLTALVYCCGTFGALWLFLVSFGKSQSNCKNTLFKIHDLAGRYSYWNHEDKASKYYCAQTPFLFAFIVLITRWILFGITTSVGLCCSGIEYCRKGDSRDAYTEIWFQFLFNCVVLFMSMTTFWNKKCIWLGYKIFSLVLEVKKYATRSIGTSGFEFWYHYRHIIWVFDWKT